MKQALLILISLFALTVNAQHIRITQLKSTGTGLLRSNESGIWSYDNSTYLTSYTETDPLFSAWNKSYNDLTNKPTIPAAQVNSDWNASSGLAQILNKPSIFSGSYTDLTNKPTLFDGAYSSLTGKPTLLSQFTNDLGNYGGFLTSYTETDPNVYSWAKSATKPTYTYSEVGAAPSSTVSFPGFGTTSLTACVGNDVRLSDSRNAADVYSWAKASTKPNYSASEVGAVPTSRNITINGITYDLSADRSWTIAGAAHDPVTLGTANGLTLSTQQLSMSLASGTVTGTLSPSDWNTFNNKLSSNQTITLGGILSGNGTTSINASAASGYYMPTTTDQSNWNGKQTALSGTGFVKISGTTISYDNSAYLTSYTETDPIFSAHTVKNISNGTGFLKNNGTGTWSYDNSTYLTSYTETDPVVKAINGIVKSNGSTLSAAVAGTDYLTPTGSAASLTNFPTLNQNTSGTAANVTGIVLGANGGTGIANSGKTITLGGNIVTGGAFNLSGAYTTALTVTNNTSITLPTTGTLSTLAGSETFTNKIYDFSSALGSNQTYSGIIESGTVGENVVFGDVLYLKFSDGKWWKAKADAYATTPAVRMAMASISANASGVLLIEGNVRYDSWSLATSNVWLSAATAGAVTTTQPSTTGNQIQYLGVAKTSTKMYFKPSNDVGEK